MKRTYCPARWRWSLAAAATIAAAGAIGCKGAEGGGPGAAASAQTEALRTLSVADVEAKMAEAKDGKVKLAVYDNNGRDEYLEGHVPGAKWVDFANVRAADLPADKSTTLVFYCHNEH